MGYANLAYYYGKIKDYEQEITYFKKAYDLCQKIHSYRTPMLLNNLAITYAEIGDTVNTVRYLNENLLFFEKTKKFNQHDKSTTLLALAEIYYLASNSTIGTIDSNKVANKKEIALAYYNEALTIATEIDDKKLMSYINNNLSLMYEQEKDYQKALACYQKTVALDDSLTSSVNYKIIAEKEAKFEYDRKADSLKYGQVILSAQLAQQTLLTKQQQQALTISNKQKELEHLQYLTTQANLQNATLQQQQSNTKISLLDKEKQLQKNKAETLEKDKIISSQQIKNGIIYLTVAGLLVGILVVLVLVTIRNKQLKLQKQLAHQQAEQQLKEAEFNSKMNDVTLSALRSQMNPHFMFNCLNSIKLYTMENNKELATTYLTKFTKLIRNTLDGSRNESITLEQELESLGLYIQLEAMRFKDKLNYKINLDKNIDTNFTEVPPMLIQPYVENAIWHGLMHKSEGGFVHVNISENQDNCLQIVIIDNGVGRSKSAELKSKTSTTHKSHGTKVTEERVAMLSEKYNTKASITTTDLFDKYQQPSGTQVTIILPFA
jgi:hypothetical protein